MTGTSRAWQAWLYTFLTLVAGALPVAAEPAAGTVDSMIVLQCGEAHTGDVSANWSPGVHVGEARTFPDHCYLIRHGDRLFLWDSGISDAVGARPEGLVVAGGLLTLRVRTTLASQLEALGVAPTDVTDIAFSHFHSDHVGNANLFTAARHFIQQPEYEVAFGPDPQKAGYAPALYDHLRANQTVLLAGDHDVFGDRSVVIIATPGHTPGHQSLLVRLSGLGPVVLTGDAVHFHENWIARRVPARNHDAGKTSHSMERIAALLAAERAVLWINHDAGQSDAIPKAPRMLR